MMNYFSFCLSGRIISSILNKKLAWGQIIFGCNFSFSTLHILCYFLLACKVTAEKLADNVVGIICDSCFLLLPLKILFKFYCFNYDMSGCTYIGFIFGWTLPCFLQLKICFLPQVKKVFSYYFIKFVSSLLLELLQCEHYCA